MGISKSLVNRGQQLYWGPQYRDSSLNLKLYCPCLSEVYDPFFETFSGFLALIDFFLFFNSFRYSFLPHIVGRFSLHVKRQVSCSLMSSYTWIQRRPLLWPIRLCLMKNNTIYTSSCDNASYAASSAALDTKDSHPDSWAFYAPFSEVHAPVNSRQEVARSAHPCCAVGGPHCSCRRTGGTSDGCR